MGRSGPKLSKSLVSELTAARARALRLRISENPNLSLAIAVFALVRRSFGGSPVAGLGIDLRATTMADHETLEQARAVLSEILPGEPEPLLDWLLQQPQRTLQEILAVIVASALDLANEGVSFDDRRKQAFADRLASVVDLDMTHFWQPDLAFWTRLPKALLLDALAGAPLVSSLPEAERATLLRAHGKLKRDDLANAVAQALNDAKWLPDLLVTPIAAGAFSVTGEGEQAVAAIAAQ